MIPGTKNNKIITSEAIIVINDVIKYICELQINNHYITYIYIKYVSQ
jgi:hypothetical protein